MKFSKTLSKNLKNSMNKKIFMLYQTRVFTVKQSTWEEDCGLIMLNFL